MARLSTRLDCSCSWCETQHGLRSRILGAVGLGAVIAALFVAVVR